MDGYAPKSIPLTNKINSTTWYNFGLLTLALLGGVVDYMSGAIYEFEQVELDIEFEQAVANGAENWFGKPRTSAMPADSVRIPLHRMRRNPMRTGGQQSMEKQP